ncbi:MAG: hypothetical protein LBS77_01955 [Desulfovibrio sp.]|jgi:hypothetical protein|nr:hypothetical protein [Desulfovibrio sp.]
MSSDCGYTHFSLLARTGKHHNPPRYYLNFTLVCGPSIFESVPLRMLFEKYTDISRQYRQYSLESSKTHVIFLKTQGFFAWYQHMDLMTYPTKYGSFQIYIYLDGVKRALSTAEKESIDLVIIALILIFMEQAGRHKSKGLRIPANYGIGIFVALFA